jgi:hypothetical protein
MSFDLNSVRRLQEAGGPPWEEYCRLVAACDASAYDSPAHRELGAFCKAYEQGQIPQAMIAVTVEEEAAQASMSPRAEDAASGRRRSRREPERETAP